jgi:hypothetical protein
MYFSGIKAGRAHPNKSWCHSKHVSELLGAIKLSPFYILCELAAPTWVAMLATCMLRSYRTARTWFCMLHHPMQACWVH